jgi:acetyl esterase/lipase
VKRLLGGLAVAAAVGLGVRAYLGRRRSMISTVPPELQHPILYVPFRLTSRMLTRAMGLIPTPGAPPVAGVTVDRRVVPGNPPVDVYVYQPSARSLPSGALLYIHGGGFVVGHPSTYHAICSRIAAELGVLVVSVDYRLALKHPFPAGLEDCFRALRWTHEQPGVDPSRVAVCGDSAGGGLAATLAQMAYDRDVPVCFQALIYPMLDDRTVLREDHLGTGGFVWTPPSNRFGWTAYLGHPPAEHEPRPYAAAARREDLTGLAPAWIGVGDLDLFHQEDVAYAGRLRAAGVPCELVVVPGMYHGADSFLDGRAASMTAFRAGMIKAIGQALAGRHSMPPG